MRILVSFFFLSFFLLACKKNTVSTPPSISFTSITPNNWLYTNIATDGPQLNFHIKDKEGDIGYNVNTNTYSYVYVINDKDTFPFSFPNMAITNDKNMDLDITVNISSIINNSLRLNTPLFPPRTDTVQFRFFVKDFAGNVSDTMTSGNFYYIIP